MVARTSAIFDTNTFDSIRLPPPLRLRGYQDYIAGGYGSVTRDRPGSPTGAPLLTALNGDNPNVHIVERLSGASSYLSFVESSGFQVTTSNHPGLDKRSDAVTVCLLRKGNAEIATGQERFDLRAGDIYINVTTNFRTTFDETDVVRLIFPSAPLKPLIRRSGEFVIIRDHDPVSRVLKAALIGLEADLRRKGVASNGPLERIAISVVSQVIEDKVYRSAISGYDILRERAREYIHDNIERPDLNVDEIATYTGASRATLYRAFESLGGVRGYISFVRLEQAKSMIGAGSTDRGDISNIAYACGFSSPEQLGKSFKKRFGVSPSQYTG